MKQYWVIENHLDGGLYLMPEDTCDMCGDCDSIIGQFSNWKQLKKEMTDDEGWCPYSDEYLQSVFEEESQ